MADGTKCVVVFDQIGWYDRKPQYPGERVPASFATRGEEVTLPPDEYERLRKLGAVGEHIDAERAKRMSADVTPANFAELKREHMESLGLVEDAEEASIRRRIEVGARPSAAKADGTGETAAEPTTEQKPAARPARTSG